MGQTFSLQLSATDSDPGQTLRYSLGQNAPAGAAIDPTSGIFTWTPNGNAAEVSVTVIATDNGSPPLSGSETFSIHVPVNQAPVLTQLGTQQASFGQPFTVQVVATDPDLGQILQYSLGAGAPAGAAIDPTSGIFTWTPSGNATYVPVTVIVTDNGSPPLSSSETFSIHVLINQPPVLTQLGMQQVVEGKPFTVQVVATDPDLGQALRYSLGPDAPAGSAIDPVTGMFTWTSQHVSADVPVTVIVTDNGLPSLSASETFHIGVADAPIVASGSGVSVVLTQGVASGNIVVGTFADANLDGSSSGYLATIDWGDHTQSTGQVAFLGAGRIQVMGGRTYLGLGSYPVVVTLRDGDGSSATAAKTSITVQPPANLSVLFADGFNISSPAGGLSDINTQAASRQSGIYGSTVYLESFLTAAGGSNDSLSTINPDVLPGTLRLANSLSAGQPFTYVSPALNFRTSKSTSQHIHVAVNPLGPGSTAGADHWAGVVFGADAGSPKSGKGTGLLLDGSGNFQVWNRGKLVKSGQIGARNFNTHFYAVDIDVNLKTGRYAIALDGRTIFQGKHGSAYSTNYVSLESISLSGTGIQYDYFDDLAIESVLQKRRGVKGR